MPAATTSGADASNGSSAHNRQHNQGNQERKYTAEQKAAVLRIRKCEPTAFYEILEVSKTCTDAEIKKAYRKQSLLTHPDKNGHEHADEAFKMVSRAFSVLGDKEKRDKYDRFGTDPDSRFASAQQQNPFAGFANRGAARAHQGGMWGDDADISPEEMFARFFGGGGFGGGPFGAAFDGGPQFVFNFGGGPGIWVHQFGGGRPRTRPRQAGQQQEGGNSMWSTLMSLLPIIILFIFPMISSLFSGATTGPSTPAMAFEQAIPPYTMARKMPNVKVNYYVNPNDVRHYSASKLYNLDQKAELIFVQQLQQQCEREMTEKRRLIEEAQGWFRTDQEKLAKAERFETPACIRIKNLYSPGSKY